MKRRKTQVRKAAKTPATPKQERNRSQYTQFRHAFKKWFAKYSPAARKAKLSTEGVTLYDEKKNMLATYFAPDYTHYMKWVCRKLL